jgi:hypothetical protein
MGVDGLGGVRECLVLRGVLFRSLVWR